MSLKQLSDEFDRLEALRQKAQEREIKALAIVQAGLSRSLSSNGTFPTDEQLDEREAATKEHDRLRAELDRLMDRVRGYRT